MNKKALIVVDHGSKKEKANKLLDEIVMYLQKKKTDIIIEPAHMELAEPSISNAIKTCIDNGATEIIVHPYMLSPGRHAIEDIPKMVEKESEKNPHIKMAITKPLGLDDGILDTVLKRYSETEI